MRKIRVLGLIPDPRDGTSYYRSAGPMNSLARRYPDRVEFKIGGKNLEEYEWYDLETFDCVLAQRPSLPNHSTVIQRARELDIPVWVDYDDLLTAVPRDNPAAVTYMTDQMQSSMRQALAMANVVTTSTNFLAAELQKIVNTACYVTIPNAVPARYIPRPTSTRPPVRKRVVAWRGSNTHAGDFWEHQAAILEAYNKHKDWLWFFIGWEPVFITEKMDPGTYGVAPFAPLTSYFKLMQRVQPDVMYVPLKDNAFNRAKSNINLQEGAWAHAAIVAPDWEEWRQPGVMTYDSTHSIGDVLDHVLSGQQDLETLNGETWDHILQTQTLEIMNAKRLELLENLIAMPK